MWFSLEAFSIKLKHVALDLHFMRERTESSDIVVNHIPDKDQWTDVLTKALPPKTFTKLESKLVGEPPRA